MFICPALSGKDGWWFLQNYCPLELTPLRNYRLRMYHVSCMYTLSELGNRDNGRAKVTMFKDQFFFWFFAFHYRSCDTPSKQRGLKIFQFLHVKEARKLWHVVALWVIATLKHCQVPSSAIVRCLERKTDYCARIRSHWQNVNTG